MYHKLTKENNLIPAGFLQCHFWMLPVIENLTQSQYNIKAVSAPAVILPPSLPSPLSVCLYPHPIPVLSVHFWFCIQP